MDMFEIQTRLKKLGYYLGNIDGIEGPQTKGATIGFQAANPPLAVDGIPGVATQAVLLRLTTDGPIVTDVGIITAERLHRAFSTARQDIISAFNAIPDEIAIAGLTTPRRVVQFLANVGHESGGLRLLEENLNYSAAGLVRTFSKYFSAMQAQEFAHKPEAIANRVYGGRMGNVHHGDGWKYRGGGLMQTTGREGYRRINHEDDPEVVRTPLPGLRAALNFWHDHGCSAIADTGNTTALRRVINGGTNGLREVFALRDHLEKVFG